MVKAEVAEAFAGYERALMGYDPDALDDFFWRDDRAVRFGIAESLYGHAAIAAYRRTRTTVPQRVLSNTRIVAIGRDAATVNTEFRYPGDPRVGRQSQVWGACRKGGASLRRTSHFKKTSSADARLREDPCGW